MKANKKQIGFTVIWNELLSRVCLYEEVKVELDLFSGLLLEILFIYVIL